MRLILFLAMCTVASGQPVQVGVKGGVPLLDFFQNGVDGSRICGCFASFTSRPVRYAVGPSVELLLPFRLSLEVNAVYQRFHYSFNAGYGFLDRVQAVGGATGNAWDFPVLLKHRLGHAMARPFVSGG